MNNSGIFLRARVNLRARVLWGCYFSLNTDQKSAFVLYLRNRRRV